MADEYPEKGAHEIPSPRHGLPGAITYIYVEAKARIGRFGRAKSIWQVDVFRYTGDGDSDVFQLAEHDSFEEKDFRRIIGRAGFHENIPFHVLEEADGRFVMRSALTNK